MSEIDMVLIDLKTTAAVPVVVPREGLAALGLGAPEGLLQRVRPLVLPEVGPLPEPAAAPELADEGRRALGHRLVDVLEVRHEAVAVPAGEAGGDGLRVCRKSISLLRTWEA